MALLLLDKVYPILLNEADPALLTIVSLLLALELTDFASQKTDSN